MKRLFTALIASVLLAGCGTPNAPIASNATQASTAAAPGETPEVVGDGPAVITDPGVATGETPEVVGDGPAVITDPGAGPVVSGGAEPEGIWEGLVCLPVRGCTPLSVEKSTKPLAEGVDQWCIVVRTEEGEQSAIAAQAGGMWQRGLLNVTSPETFRGMGCPLAAEAAERAGVGNAPPTAEPVAVVQVVGEPIPPGSLDTDCTAANGYKDIITEASGTGAWCVVFEASSKRSAYVYTGSIMPAGDVGKLTATETRAVGLQQRGCTQALAVLQGT